MKHFLNLHIPGCIIFAVIAATLAAPRLAAQPFDGEPDPCGHDLLKSGAVASPLLWGYERDALVSDLQRWAVHPWVGVDVIGYSVRQAPLYHVVLTNPSSTVKKKRIWIHARTHPIEAESSWLTRAIIDELLSGSAVAASVLDHCIVHVLPMLNPDGVELRNPRENANGIDIESNWGAAVPQPEVQALKHHLDSLMRTSSPIEVALNLHSAYQCRRYFVYHDPVGTSELFATQQQRFINHVRARFPGGIEPYDYFVTWTAGTPDRYPESWFWLNFRESVMALTYEDMNCATAGEYDRTAQALLGGTADYLGLFGPVGVDVAGMPAAGPTIEALYPQPLYAGTAQRLNILVRMPERGEHVRIDILDALGRVVANLWDGEMSGRRVLSDENVYQGSGIHFIRLASDNGIQVKPFQVIR